MKVYLAGGIAGLTKEEALGWRLETAYKLKSLSIEGLIPNSLLSNNVDKDRPYTADFSKESEALSEVFTSDIEMINRSDLVFARLDTAKSFGTAWELGYAYGIDKPIILVVNEDMVHHPFVQGCAEVVCTDWKDGLQEVLKWLIT
jgi:nucleoside 2-deoxyribosyltransferase